MRKVLSLTFFLLLCVLQAYSLNPSGRGKGTDPYKVRAWTGDSTLDAH
jgi:hypothetical protein